MKFTLKANYFGIHLQRTMTLLESFPNTLEAVEISVVGVTLRIQMTKKPCRPPASQVCVMVWHLWRLYINDLVIAASC